MRSTCRTYRATNLQDVGFLKITLRKGASMGQTGLEEALIVVGEYSRGHSYQGHIRPTQFIYRGMTR